MTKIQPALSSILRHRPCILIFLFWSCYGLYMDIKHFTFSRLQSHSQAACTICFFANKQSIKTFKWWNFRVFDVKLLQTIQRASEFSKWIKLNRKPFQTILQTCLTDVRSKQMNNLVCESGTAERNIVGENGSQVIIGYFTGVFY